MSLEDKILIHSVLKQLDMPRCGGKEKCNLNGKKR